MPPLWTCFFLVVITLACLLGNALGFDECNEGQRSKTPHLCHMLDRVHDDPELLADDLKEFSRQIGLVMETVGNQNDLVATKRSLREGDDINIPVVMAHGMGDSCFNGECRT